MGSSHCCQSCYNLPLLPPAVPRDKGRWLFSEGGTAPSIPCKLAGGPDAKVKLDSALPCACKPMQSAGSGSPGNLPWTLVGSLDRGVQWLPRGQNRALAAVFVLSQGKGMSWADWLCSGTWLDELVQVKGFSFQFLQCSGKREVLEKEKCKPVYFRKDLQFYLWWRKCQKCPAFLCCLLFERSSPILQLLSSLPTNYVKVNQWEVSRKQ